MRKAVPVIICVFVLVIALLVNAFISSARINELNLAQRGIDDVQAQIDMRKTELANTRTSAVENVGGISFDRVGDDTLRLRELFETVCTWDDFEQYTAAREKVIDKYGIDEKSDFLQTYMPDIQPETDMYGVTTNMIDDRDYNMSLNDLDVRAIGVSAGTYSYFVTVTVESGFLDQTGQSTSAVLVDMAADGEILSLTCIPVTV